MEQLFTWSKCIQHQRQSISVSYLLLNTLDLYFVGKKTKVKDEYFEFLFHGKANAY